MAVTVKIHVLWDVTPSSVVHK